MKNIIILILFFFATFARGENANFKANEYEMQKSMANLIIKDLDKPNYIKYKSEFSKNYVFKLILGAPKKETP